jgi:hypothetical protein
MTTTTPFHPIPNQLELFLDDRLEVDGFVAFFPEIFSVRGIRGGEMEVEGEIGGREGFVGC